MNNLIIDKKYINFLETVLERIQLARISASKQLIHATMELYFGIGKIIVEQQEKHGWGKSVVEQLAKDLHEITDGTHSFSERNLWFMKQFYTEYVNYPDLHNFIFEVPWGKIF